MKIPWPRSLQGQMIALVLLGLGIAQVLGFMVYRIQHQSTLRTLRDMHALGRIAAVVRLLADTPPALHERIVRAGSSRPLRLVITNNPVLETSTVSRRAMWLRQRLAALVETDIANIRIGLRTVEMPEGRGLSERHEARHERSAEHHHDDVRRQQRQRHGRRHRHAKAPGLAAAVRLGDGRWLQAANAGPQPEPFWQGPMLLSAGLTALILSVLMILMVRRITRPLATLAAEADRFGRGEAAEPLAEHGPTDLRHTIQAFNHMRTRLERFVQDRTHMLAAISHDLRTPMTALRVRAELIDDAKTRDKICATLDEMQHMTEATLAFVREEATQDDTRLVDCIALVESLCDDLSDLGSDVTFSGSGRVPYRCRPVSLKRALGNLIENAVTYGQRARVRVIDETAMLRIEIDDDGPGIAASDMARVFEPFVRLEASRSHDTGGVGLGLAIARSIVHRHGGDITLANRPEGGLRVAVRLPTDSNRGQHGACVLPMLGPDGL